MIAGEYAPPPCPPLSLLEELLDVCYLAASSPEEGRYPQFNVVACTREHLDRREFPNTRWLFTSGRPFCLDELRRLAPAVDIKKSAVLVVWDEDGWSIIGLLDLGTSWHRARVGLGYWYTQPHSLLIQVDRPGRLRIYQGQFHVGTLADGQVEIPDGIEFGLFLMNSANAGLKSMESSFQRPEYEDVKSYREFEFMAIWNTYAAIANLISSLKHGGMLVILPNNAQVDASHIKIKYQSQSVALQTAFVDFIKARHLMGDANYLLEQGKEVSHEWLCTTELDCRLKYDALVEATRFAASLSGCDGSIVIKDDLVFLGFGAEISAELSPDVKIVEIDSELKRTKRPCDIEQFGMRHRSAIKLASRDHHCRILVVSQDGPVSGIWWEDECVLVRKNLQLVNINMPWA